MAIPPVVVPVRYPQFYLACRDVAGRALDLLRPRLGEPPVWPTREGRRIVFEANGSHFEIINEEYPGDAVGQIYEDLRESAGYRRAFEELANLRNQGNVIPQFAGMADYISPAISGYLNLYRSLNFSEERFRDAYYPVEEYLASRTAQIRIYLRLPGLQGDIDDVDLSTRHRIYRLDAVEINRIWKIIEPPGFPVQLRSVFGTYPQPGTYMLSAVMEYQKAEMNMRSVLLSSEETRLTRALRLSAPGGGPVQFETYEDVGFAPQFFRLGFQPQIKSGSYSYQIDGGTADCLRRHWPASLELSGKLQHRAERVPAHIRISANRFSGSSDKIACEDQLIDFSIALEALFTKENDAVSYRLPLRGAIWVGDTAEERERAFAILKAAYDVRSNLAHGQDQLEQTIKVRAERVPVDAFMNELRKLLFKCFHRFLKTQATHSKDVALRAIDNAIISVNRAEVEQLWA